MADEREVILRFVARASGFDVFDAAGNKINELTRKTLELGAAQQTVGRGLSADQLRDTFAALGGGATQSATAVRELERAGLAATQGLGGLGAAMAVALPIERTAQITAQATALGGLAQALASVEQATTRTGRATAAALGVGSPAARFEAERAAAIAALAGGPSAVAAIERGVPSASFLAQAERGAASAAAYTAALAAEEAAAGKAAVSTIKLGIEAAETGGIHLPKLGYAAGIVESRLVALTTGSQEAGLAVRSLGIFGGQAGLLLGAGIAAGAVAIGAIVEPLREVVQEAGQLDSVSRATGLSVQSLAAYDVAAMRAGANTAQFGKEIEHFTGQLTGVGGDTTRTARLLGVFGIDAADALKNPTRAVDQLARAFELLPPGVIKANVAVALFGGDAGQTIEVLHQIAIETQATRERSKEYAHTMAEATPKVRQLTEDWRDFTTALHLTAAEIGTSMLPALTSLVQGLNNLPSPVDFFMHPGALRQKATADVNKLAAGGLGPPPADAGQFFTGVSGSGWQQELLRQQGNALAANSAIELMRRNQRGGGTHGDIQADIDRDVERSIAAEQKTVELQSREILEQDKQDLATYQHRLSAEADLATTQKGRLSTLLSGSSQELALAEQIDEARASALDVQAAGLVDKAKAFAEDESKTPQETQALLDQADIISRQATYVRGIGGEWEKVNEQVAKTKGEYDKLSHVNINIGDIFDRSIQQATQGILNRGGKFDIKNLVEGTGDSIASELIGGFVKAELKKHEFDTTIGKNFTGTLPGFMKTGADSIKSIWSSTMDFLGRSTRTATQGVGQDVSSALSGVQKVVTTFTSAGPTSPTSEIGGYAGGADSGGFTAGDLGGQSSIVGGTSAFGGADASGAGAITGGAGAGAGLGAAAGIAGIALVVAQTAIQATDNFKAANKELVNKIEQFHIQSDADFRHAQQEAIGKALPLIGSFAPLFAKTASHGIGQNAAWAALDPIFPGMSYLAPLFLNAVGAFRAPTVGTQIEIALESLLHKAGDPGTFIRKPSITGSPTQDIFDQWQTLLGADIRTGHTNAALTQRIQLNAQPGVEGLRTGEAFGLAEALFPGRPGRAATAANALVNNFEALGISANEARRELLSAAQAAGVTFVGALNQAEKAFLRHPYKAGAYEELKAAVKGDVSLFGNLPPGFTQADYDALIAANTTPKAPRGQKQIGTPGLDEANLLADIQGRQDAYSIRNQIAQERTQDYTGGQQLNYIKNQIAETERQLQRTDQTTQQREQLYQRLNQLGAEYVSAAGSQYAQGSYARISAESYGYGIQGEAATGLDRLGSGAPVDPTTEANTKSSDANTKSQDKNTDATDRNTEAHKHPGKQEIIVTVQGLTGQGGVPHAPSPNDPIIRSIADAIMHSPAFGPAVRRHING